MSNETILSPLNSFGAEINGWLAGWLAVDKLSQSCGLRWRGLFLTFLVFQYLLAAPLCIVHAKRKEATGK